jgi:protein O-GlcNAc transferase
MVLTPTSPTLEITASEQLADWLQSQQISFAFTTYQTNRLFFIGSNHGRIAAKERLFDKPMGLYAEGTNLYMSTRSQIWRLDNTVGYRLESYTGEVAIC